MKTPTLKAPGNFDPDENSRQSALTFDDTDDNAISMTVQSFAKECDINEIVKRFGLTGELPSSIRMPLTGDYTNVPDFHQAMNLVAQAKTEFLKLPASLRARFDHNPANLVTFLEDENNREEAIKLGIVNQPIEKPIEPPKDPPKG